MREEITAKETEIPEAALLLPGWWHVRPQFGWEVGEA